MSSTIPVIQAYGRTAGGVKVQLKVDSQGRLVTSGGGGTGGMGLDVRDFGAEPDGTTDSTAAIQAAIDEAIDTGQDLYFPKGTGAYITHEPIIVAATHLPTLIGEGGWGADVGTPITGSEFIGPLFYVRGDTPVQDLDLAPSLVSGAGFSLETLPATQGPDSWIDFQDVGGAANLQGRTQLCVGFFLKVRSYSSFQSGVFRPYGSLLGSSNTSAFRVKLDATGHLITAVNVAGTATEKTGAGALALDTVYYVELNYDGSNVYCFYGEPGQMTTQAGTTTAATGTVSMNFTETWANSGVRQHWPHGDAAGEPVDGWIDSIRVSSVARHTANFTAPSTKQAFDGSTLFLCNFDNITDQFVIVETNSEPAYIPIRGSFSGTQGQGFDMSHFDLRTDAGSNGGGCCLFLNGVIQSYIHDMSMTGGHYGVDTNNDTFLDVFERLYFLNNDFCAMAIMSQGGINYYNEFDGAGQRVFFAAREGSGVLSNFYPHGSTQVCPVVLYSGGWVLQSMHFSNEDASSANYVANMLLDSPYNIEIVGGDFERSINTGPSIIIKGNEARNIVSLGGRWHMHASATQVVELVSGAVQPMVMYNPSKDEPTVPWSVSPKVSVFPESLKGNPTIASGFGTTPAIVAGNGYQSFRVTVGTGGSDTSGILTMPFAAATGWNVIVNNLTAALDNAAYNTRQISSTTTTVTLENQTTSTGAAIAWTAGDVLVVTATPY